MKEVLNYLRKNKERSIEELMEFCSYPSISTSGKGIREVVDIVAQKLKETGAEVKAVETEGHPVVYGGLEGRGEKTLLFYNHYDVQPPDPLEKWDSPPFEPDRRNGRVFARGVSDNKGNIMARLQAIRSIQEKGKLPINVKFVIEGEEEIGSPHFEEFVRENQELVEADACIWESGGKNEEGKLEVTLGLKGIAYLELISEGPKRDLHSSLGTIVPNPAWKLVRALATIRGKNGKVLIDGFYDKVREPLKEESEAVEKIEFHEDEKREIWGINEFEGGLTGEELKKRHFLKPTANICGLKSGWIKEGSKTVLPSKAKAKVGFRLVPNQKPSEIKELLEAHLDRRGFEDIEVRDLEGEPPARTPIDSKFVKLVKEVSKKTYEKKPVIHPTSPGSGPMHWIRKQGYPVVSVGVGYYDSRAHAPNENIRVKDYIQGIENLIRIIQNF